MTKKILSEHNFVDEILKLFSSGICPISFFIHIKVPALQQVSRSRREEP